MLLSLSRRVYPYLRRSSAGVSSAGIIEHRVDRASSPIPRLAECSHRGDLRALPVGCVVRLPAARWRGRLRLVKHLALGLTSKAVADRVGGHVDGIEAV